jgi:prepilin peptidase CpaA
MSIFSGPDMTVMQLTVLFALLACAVATDVQHRLIPNWLTYPSMVLGVFLGTISSGFPGGAESAAGICLGATLFALPVVILGRGAGDLKLLAALGSIGGPIFVLWCALFAEIAGGLLSAAPLISRGRLGTTVAAVAVDIGGGHVPAARSQISIPYAVPMCAGALAAMFLM